jgi:hypothetical protein
MTIKVQIFFQSTAQGWTETYYNGSTDPQGFITDFSTGQPSQGDGGALCARRRSILAAQSSITGARAALEGEQRQAASIEFAYNTFNGLYSFSIGAEQAEIYSSLLCRLNTTGLVIHQKNLYLGGLPEDIVGDTGAYTPGHAVGPWTAVMKVFIKRYAIRFLVHGQSNRGDRPGHSQCRSRRRGKRRVRDSSRSEIPERMEWRSPRDVNHDSRPGPDGPRAYSAIIRFLARLGYEFRRIVDAVHSVLQPHQTIHRYSPCRTQAR